MPLHIWQNQNQYRDGKLDNDQPHDGGKGNIDLGVYDRSGNRVRKSNGMVQLDDSVIYLITQMGWFSWMIQSSIWSIPTWSFRMIQLDDPVGHLINCNRSSRMISWVIQSVVQSRLSSCQTIDNDRMFKSEPLIRNLTRAW